MNRVIYPASVYPLAGDTQSQPGSTLVKVVGIQSVPVTQVTFLGGEILTYDNQAAAWVPQQITGAANEFLATPNGAAGQATLRTIVPADLPIATNTTLGVVYPDNSTITIDSGGKLSAVGGGGGTPSQSDVTSSRNFGTVYQNTSTQRMQVSGWGDTSGSGTGAISIAFGPTSAPAVVYSNENTASVSGGAAGFLFIVPPSWYYEITVSGDIASLGRWVETLF